MCQYTTSCCIAFHIDLTLLMYSRNMWIATFLKYVTWKWSIITLHCKTIPSDMKCTWNKLPVLCQCVHVFSDGRHKQIHTHTRSEETAGWTCCMVSLTCYNSKNSAIRNVSHMCWEECSSRFNILGDMCSFVLFLLVIYFTWSLLYTNHGTERNHVERLLLPSLFGIIHIMDGHKVWRVCTRFNYYSLILFEHFGGILSVGVFISINMVFVLLTCSSLVISCFAVVQITIVLFIITTPQWYNSCANLLENILIVQCGMCRWFIFFKEFDVDRVCKT